MPLRRQRIIALCICVAIGASLVGAILVYALNCDYWSGESLATCRHFSERLFSERVLGFIWSVLGLAGVWAAIRATMWRRFRNK